MITVSIDARLPDEKAAESFLLWVRAFDKWTPGCHFSMLTEGGNQTMGETVQLLERMGLEIRYVERK